MRTAVLLKRVDLRPAADPLTGARIPDPYGGLSAADRCALELAVRTGTDVLAVSAGPADAETVLRAALEAGATAAVRVDLPAAAPSVAVAAALARVVAGRDLLWCGDHSLDRGSGAVPAFLAGHLGIAQVLGLSAVEVVGTECRCTRRLDRGRREQVLVRPPAVLGVEAGVVAPRRPSLTAVLAAREVPITVVAAEPVAAEAGLVAAFRPRARILPGPDPTLPARARLIALSGALAEHHPPQVVHAEPGEAADAVLAFLRARDRAPGGEPHPDPGWVHP